jgi:CheY-like chemotaxis protein
MKKKLGSVLLIDDDEDCNFFHERLFRKMNCVEKVYVAQDGEEALEFLRSTIEEAHTCPSIIFLDINMPRMNGWDFLKEYDKLDMKYKAKVVLIMLTTSLNPEDKARALSYKAVDGFENKYLTKESVEQLLAKYFPE